MALISKKIVLLNLPLLKTVVGRKTNLLANRKNKTICSLFGLVGVALAKNSFASSSGLVTVSKVLNIFLSLFLVALFYCNKTKQVNFLSDYVVHYVVDYIIELYDTYIRFSDRYT